MMRLLGVVMSTGPPSAPATCCPQFGLQFRLNLPESKLEVA